MVSQNPSQVNYNFNLIISCLQPHDMLESVLKHMNYLDKLENKTIYILREAYNRFRDVGLLWSIGKDSTALLWISRKAFFGKIPFPVIYIDTSFKFKEIYSFRDKYAAEWNLNLIIGRNEEALKQGISPVKGKYRFFSSGVPGRI